jgi:hypothetical protein
MSRLLDAIDAALPTVVIAYVLIVCAAGVALIP